MGPGLRRDDEGRQPCAHSPAIEVWTKSYRPSHFGGRFSENAFGPSM
ncbi:hypothetical protein ABIE91_007043 [Bradyrhizobium elkanii]